jgi:hypothetical protein
LDFNLELPGNFGASKRDLGWEMVVVLAGQVVSD